MELSEKENKEPSSLVKHKIEKTLSHKRKRENLLLFVDEGDKP